MDSKKHIVGIVIAMSFVTMPMISRAMVNPEIIQWNGESDGFVNSVYQATFGRTPTQNDWEHIQQFNGKLDLFLSLINSTEYDQKFGYLDRNLSVYWNTRYMDTENGSRLCDCYYIAKSLDGLIPDPQYTGVNFPPEKQNYPVARALTLMCAAFDDETCPLYDCGYSDFNKTTNESSASPAQGANLVDDPNFSGFNGPNNPWGRDDYSGPWWGEANCTVRTVELGGDGAKTALYIMNQSPRSSSIYGTTAQKIPAIKGRTYEVSFYAEARGLGSKGAIRIVIDRLWTIQPIKMDAGTYKFKQFTGTFVAPEDVVDLRILSDDVGEVWITGMTLTEQ